MKLLRLLKLGMRENNEEHLLKVYSHPRSGTHFLEAFIAENFYSHLNLKIDEVEWGHWSDRRININGNEYGKLFGNHYFPERNNNNLKKVYIYRDGRAVSYSVWKTDNFLNKNFNGMEFNSFLRKPIDWYGTPSQESKIKWNILEHWAEHVVAWKRFEKKNEKTIILKYEDLMIHPYEQYVKIKNKFFPSLPLKKESEIKRIQKPIGLLPNKASIDAWKEIYDRENLEYFQGIVKKYNLQEYKN